jgi:GNAT superfamily N-acetyltransferase
MAPSTAHSRVRVVRVNTAELTVADRDRIEKFITVYSFYDRAVLDATLDAANYIWLCLDSKGRVLGTTAVRRVQLPAGTGGHGSSVTVVYTSIVAVNPDYRRLGLPARMGLKTYLHERMRAPFTPLYWLAEAVSPAGYLQMSRNVGLYWPRPGERVPEPAQAIIDATLVATGVKRISRVGDSTLIREDYPVIEKDQSPIRWNHSGADVDFFLRVNPDYWTGSALVCLAPLNFVSVMSAVSRNLLKVMTRKRTAPQMR